MQLMTDLKTFFTRRRPRTAIAFSGTQAAALTEHREDTLPSDSSSPPANVSIETKPTRRQSVSELQRGYDEVLGVVRRIGEHLDEQRERSERIVELLDRLPQALDVMPEISRQNIRLLESITEYLEESRRREESINATLMRLGESADNQTEIVGLVQQQLNTGNDSARQMSAALTDFRASLGELSASTTRSTDVLASMNKTGEARDARLMTIMSRTERWMIAAMACSIVAAGTAVAVAVFAAVR